MTPTSATATSIRGSPKSARTATGSNRGANAGLVRGSSTRLIASRSMRAAPASMSQTGATVASRCSTARALSSASSRSTRPCLRTPNLQSAICPARRRSLRAPLRPARRGRSAYRRRRTRFFTLLMAFSRPHLQAVDARRQAFGKSLGRSGKRLETIRLADSTRWRVRSRTCCSSPSF